MKTRARLAALLASQLVALSCGSPEPERPEPLIRLFEDLGDYGRSVTTDSPEAQAYFDQGLVLTYGFNHDAAVRSYRSASAIDPDCAMCYWGEALALGPNINAPMGPAAHLEARAAIEKAQRAAGSASEVERGLIAALATRYDPAPEAQRAQLDRAYAEALRALYQSHPTDDEVATLFAASLMNLNPWHYYEEDGTPGPGTDELVAALEGVMERTPRHPGANHYYIHAVEPSDTPERGVPAADRLVGLVPGSGHLTHMPTHIYWRVGRYDDAGRLNKQAVGVDEQTVTWCGSAGFYGVNYSPHNIHFIWAASSAQGNSDLALSSARKLAASVEPKLAEWAFVEEYLTVPILTLVRFGRWDQVLAEPKPDQSLRYASGIWHYARGLARTRLGELEDADRELAALDAVASEGALEEFWISGGLNQASTLLRIGVLHRGGELAAARGEYDEAVAQLEASIAVQDDLAYMEPPPWYLPVRQALGAVLLEAQRPAQAETVYRADLDQHPQNGWSLFGLAESLRQQERGDEAALVERGFQESWQHADVTLVASRF